MFDLFRHYDSEVVSGIIALLIAISSWIFQSRVKLVWGLSHGFVHSLDLSSDENGDKVNVRIQTASHLVANLGRKTANKVEITFNFRPAGFEIWPQRQFELRDNPNGRFIIIFDTLSPKEQCSLNLVAFGDLETPNLLGARCAEATGREIRLTTNRLIPRPIQLVSMCLFFVGIIGTIYLFIQMVGWFAKLSGMVGP